MGSAEDIIAYINDELLDDPDLELDSDTSLFQERVLDSLNLVMLISYLEKTYQIKIKSSEVTIENLDSVTKMIDFIERKTS